MTIDERISKIETHYREGAVPGTSLTRVSNPYPQRGTQWCFGFGHLQEAKQFFYGDTIEDVVTQVERWLGKGVLHHQQNCWTTISKFREASDA